MKNWFINKNIAFTMILTFIIGLSITITIFFKAQEWEQTRLQQTFEFSAQSRLAAFSTDIARHQEVVNSVANLFASSEYVTRKEFQNFVEDTLNRNLNILGLSWNPVIKHNELENYVKKAIKDGFSDFEITSLNSNGERIKSPVQDDYIVVYYIEPYLKNKKAMGFNIASNPAREEAIKKAIKTGKTVITERINLVQGSNKTFGYLMLKAVYEKEKIIDTIEKRRKHFLGLSVGVFTFKEWIPLSMRDITPSGIDFLISDTTEPSDIKFLHYHSSRTRNGIYEKSLEKVDHVKSGLYWEATIDVLERKWSFLFTPAPKFIDNNRHWQSWVFLLVGLVITYLLLLTIFIKSKNLKELKKDKNLLENAVMKRTQELVASKEDAEKANNELKKYKDELEIRIEEELEKNKKQTAYLVQQSRLAQMGEMISMIAHQWRQPLGAIAAVSSDLNLKIQLEVFDLKEDKGRQECKTYFSDRFERIGKFVQSLTTTINDFKDFYKPDLTTSEILIKDPIDKALSIMKDSLRTNGIEVVETYSCNEKVNIHSNEMMQVILNILNNSQDNFRGKGISSPKISITCTESDNKITIEICDNGGGIPKDILPKIFNPYFSTKEAKNGTGLGLYMSKIIIEEHHKGSFIASNLDDGACFSIVLNRE